MTGLIIYKYAFISLFSIVNPIGMAPIFLSLTKDQDRKRRHYLAYQVALYGFLLLIGCLFLGPSILHFFGITLPFVQIAGGMMVFFTAWEMIYAKPKISSEEKTETLHHSDIAFFPLTMPLTAGAGSIAICITISEKLTYTNIHSLIDYGIAILAILTVFAIVAFCYRFADIIFSALGKTGTNVVTRISALILLAIGIEVIWSGLVGLSPAH